MHGEFVTMKMNKRDRMEIQIYREVWIIPTSGGFLPREMNKRCRMEIYIYRRSLNYTNAQWMCTYEDE